MIFFQRTMESWQNFNKNQGRVWLCKYVNRRRFENRRITVRAFSIKRKTTLKLVSLLIQGILKLRTRFMFLPCWHSRPHNMSCFRVWRDLPPFLRFWLNGWYTARCTVLFSQLWGYRHTSLKFGKFQFQLVMKGVLS